jgi:hypothetical protein
VIPHQVREGGFALLKRDAATMATMCIAGIPADIWQLVLRHLELYKLCMFGASCRTAASQAFSCEHVWKLVRLPRKSETLTSGILRLGASLGRPLCVHLDATSTPFLEDSALISAATAMPLLERINLTGCRRLKNAVVTLAQTCTALTAIQCASNPRLSDAEIVSLVHHAGSRLTHLDLSGCSVRIGDDSARALGLCTALRELRLSNCKRLSNDGAVAMFSGGANLDRASEPSAAGEEHERIEEHGDGSVAGACSRISRRQCPLAGLGGGMLMSLELSGCDKLTDVALVALAKHCSKLVHLDLSISDTFSPQMIAHVFNSARNLCSIDLVGVGRLTDDALMFLPSSLESISLAATRITDAVRVCVVCRGYVCVRE